MNGISTLDQSFGATTAIVPGRFVKITGPYTVAQAGAGEAAIGVALEEFDPQVDGRHGGVAVRLLGVASVIAGAAITAGQALEVDAQGRAVPLATGKQVAVALSNAVSAGYEVDVILK